MNKFIVLSVSICLIILLFPFAFAKESVTESTIKTIDKKSKVDDRYEVVNVKSFLNIRSGPGTIYSILRAIPSTEENITIIKSKQLDKSIWVKIKHNGKYGWVNRIYLQVSETNTDVKETSKSEEPEKTEQDLLWLTMSGVYSLTNIEPMKGETMDTHVLFQIESEQAKVIYDAIKTPSFIDKCTGATAKKIGEMICLHYPTQQEEEAVTPSPENYNEGKVEKIEVTSQTKDNNNESENEDENNKKTVETNIGIEEIYECHFSINIMKQKIQQGIPCEE